MCLLSGDTHPTIWLDLAFTVPFFGGDFWIDWFFGGGNDSEFYMATSLYRSVDGSWLSLIREPQ